MKKICVLLAVFLFVGGLFSANAMDLIVLKDGTMIEAKVTEISPAEIRYKRASHLDGPTIVVPTANVLSIRYENGTVEVINASAVGSVGQEGVTLSQPSALQTILNALPAVPIAGNSLKFEFGGESWVARVNGENFSAGTIEFEESEAGGILTLSQTHIWPGAVGKTAGRVAGAVPGGGAVGGALTAAGSVAGALGPVEASGTIVLEYRAGPPASLKLVSSSGGASPHENKMPAEKTANARNNWISGEVAYWGIGVRYERMLASKISLGANFYWGPPLLHHPDYFEINAFFRFYPWGKTFFLGMGLGYNCDYPSGDWLYDNEGFAITPEIGWKIDVGKPGGFYIMPCITFPVVFGGKQGVWPGWRFVYFGMGGAF